MRVIARVVMMVCFTLFICSKGYCSENKGAVTKKMIDMAKSLAAKAYSNGNQSKLDVSNVSIVDVGKNKGNGLPVKYRITGQVTYKDLEDYPPGYTGGFPILLRNTIDKKKQFDNIAVFRYSTDEFDKLIICTDGGACLREGEKVSVGYRLESSSNNAPTTQTQDYTSKFLELKKACELGNDDACISVRGSKGYDDSINEYGYYMLLGSRYNYRKNYDDAIKIYDLAVKFKPNEIGAFRDRSAIYIKTKQYKKAFDDADRVKKFNPQGGLYLRARVLWHQGKTNSSIKEMEKCCKIKHSSECDDLSEANLSKLFDLN